MGAVVINWVDECVMKVASIELVRDFTCSHTSSNAGLVDRVIFKGTVDGNVITVIYHSILCNESRGVDACGSWMVLIDGLV